jgi:hypothetical protein
MFYTFVFSIISSVILIIHGLFFDLDITQIKRLTIEGFCATFILVFVALIILEKIFTLKDDEEIINIKKRLNKLEKRK